MTPPSVSGDGEGPLPKILAGGPTRETSSLVYQLHRESLERQAGEDFAIEVRHEVVPDPGGARWQHDKIQRVARVRQSFMADALHDFTRGTGFGFNALFMVDSD